MQAMQRLAIQAEITLEHLFQAVSHLSLQDKLALQRELKKQVLREQMEKFIAPAQEAPLSAEEIMAEVKAARNAKHGKLLFAGISTNGSCRCA